MKVKLFLAAASALWASAAIAQDKDDQTGPSPIEVLQAASADDWRALYPENTLSL